MYWLCAFYQKSKLFWFGSTAKDGVTTPSSQKKKIKIKKLGKD